MAYNFTMQGAGVGGYLSEDRNLLINGDMFVDQKNEGASTSFSSGGYGYALDGVKVGFVSSTAAITAQRVADAPAGFTYSLKVTTTTGAGSVAAGDYLGVQIPVEGPLMRYLGYGSANAGSASLSFWVKSSNSGGVVFSVALQNAAGNRTQPVEFRIGSYGAWTHVLLKNITGDVTGTWSTGNNTKGLVLIFTVGSGTGNKTGSYANSGGANVTNGTPFNTWNGNGLFAASSVDNLGLTTTGSTFQVTGVQFEHGPVCTPYALRKYDKQLNDCRRFYRKSFPAGTAPAQNAGAANAVAVRNAAASGNPAQWVPFEPPMAGTPNITTYNPSASNGNWRDLTASADVAVSVDPASNKGPNGVLLVTSGAVAAQGDVLAIHYTADATL